MEIRGRTIIVTGGGSGIGRAIAQECARAGARVVVCGRRLEQLAETATLVKNAGGVCEAIRTDITDPLQTEDLIKKCFEFFGTVDILINNAGSFAGMAPLWEADPTTWWRDIEINLRGTMLCCRAILPHFIERKNGMIINLSGGGATWPNLGGSSYGSSKAAVLRLTDTLAAELRVIESPVVVSALDPGFNKTAMTKDLAGKKDSHKWQPHVHRLLTEARDDQPQVCAATVLALVNEAGPEINGRLFNAGENIAEVVAVLKTAGHEKDRLLRLG